MNKVLLVFNKVAGLGRYIDDMVNLKTNVDKGIRQYKAVKATRSGISALKATAINAQNAIAPAQKALEDATAKWNDVKSPLFDHQLLTKEVHQWAQEAAKKKEIAAASVLDQTKSKAESALRNIRNTETDVVRETNKLKDITKKVIRGTAVPAASAAATLAAYKGGRKLGKGGK